MNSRKTNSPPLLPSTVASQFNVYEQQKKDSIQQCSTDYGGNQNVYSTNIYGRTMAGQHHQLLQKETINRRDSNGGGSDCGNNSSEHFGKKLNGSNNDGVRDDQGKYFSYLNNDKYI